MYIQSNCWCFGGHCNSKYDEAVGWHWQEKNNWKTLETKRENKKEKIKMREYKKPTGIFPHWGQTLQTWHISWKLLKKVSGFFQWMYPKLARNISTVPCKGSSPEVFLWKDVLKNMHQIYWRTPMLKCDFNKAAHFSIGVLLFRTRFHKNTSGGVLLFTVI